MTPPLRVLVAGVGNVLRGDDGFGPAVVGALERGGLPDGVHTVETGIGGMGVIHALMEGFDALVVVDAVYRDGQPGRLYVLEPEVPPAEDLGREAAMGVTDLHQLVPGSMMLMARALDVLPPYVRIVGCQPGSTEELSTQLSGAVAAAIPRALETVRMLVADAGRSMAAHG